MVFAVKVGSISVRWRVAGLVIGLDQFAKNCGSFSHLLSDTKSGEFFPNRLVLRIIGARLMQIRLADVCDSRIAVHDGYLPLAQRRYASIHSAPSGRGYGRERSTNG